MRAVGEQLKPWLFLSPFLVLFSVFTLYPLLFSMVLSVHSWNPVAGLGAMTFSGLENYRQGLTDPWFWASLYNTLLLSILAGVPQHIIAIPTAYLLVRSARRLRHAYSALMFVPYIASTVAVSLIFFAIYAPRSGILNQGLLALTDLPVAGALFAFIRHASPIEWLGNSTLLKPAVALVVIWKYVGFNVVIYVTAFLTVPREIEEAAEIDGCNGWQCFWLVALPMIRPFVFFATTLTIIGGLQLFEEPFILTNGESGGVGQSAMTVSYYLYLVGWQWLEMGSAAALSWILFATIACATAVHFWAFGRRGLAQDDA